MKRLNHEQYKSKLHSDIGLNEENFSNEKRININLGLNERMLNAKTDKTTRRKLFISVVFI